MVVLSTLIVLLAMSVYKIAALVTTVQQTLVEPSLLKGAHFKNQIASLFLI